MSRTETVIAGTLKPDGTLELDEKPNLSPGRVQVIVQPLAPPAPTGRGLVEVMDEIRANQRARGYRGRTLEEMQAEEQQRQEEDTEYERRCKALWGGPLSPPAGQEEAAVLINHHGIPRSSPAQRGTVRPERCSRTTDRG